jgi:hypothetical protein
MAKKPSAYTSSMAGKKYAVALTQIVSLLKGSKNALSTAQMSVKLMSPGVHRKANLVGIPAINESIHKKMGQGC